MVPFTLAHPAAVLPLRRTKLVFSALIVGSMAPDYPYFLFVRNEITWGHTLRGVILFCLPVSLAILWVFHSLVKRPLVALAPEFVRKRISKESLDFKFGPSGRFLLILASILIGTLAHIFWDAFTHDNGYFVQHWAMLSIPVETYRVMPLWRALQQACSVIGVAIVAIVTVWWWHEKPVLADPVAAELSPVKRAAIVLAGIMLSGVVGATVGFIRHHKSGWKSSLITMSISSVATGCVELLLFALIWRAYVSSRSTQHVDETETVSAER